MLEKSEFMLSSFYFYFFTVHGLKISWMQVGLNKGCCLPWKVRKRSSWLRAELVLNLVDRFSVISAANPPLSSLVLVLPEPMAARGGSGQLRTN